jgi:hypothetical protein
MTLARLTGEFLDLADKLADCDPSDPAAVALIEELLDGSAAAIRDKAAATAAVIREFEARGAAAQAEGERILRHRRLAHARATWLRAYLLRNLQTLGLERLETATTVVAIQLSPPSVEILDECQIPDAFKQIVESVNKTVLRTALLSGQSVPGARLTRGSHLVLR